MISSQLALIVTAIKVFSMELSVMVRRHRKLSGLSQTQLAKLAGVGKTVVFDIEHGKESVQLNTLKKVLAALNIELVFRSPVIARDGVAEERRIK